LKQPTAASFGAARGKERQCESYLTASGTMALSMLGTANSLTAGLSPWGHHHHFGSGGAGSLDMKDPSSMHGGLAASMHGTSSLGLHGGLSRPHHAGAGLHQQQQQSSGSGGDLGGLSGVDCAGAAGTGGSASNSTPAGHHHHHHHQGSNLGGTVTKALNKIYFTSY